MEKDQVYVNKKKFIIEKLLGKGKGGFSYLVSGGDSKYVVKQVRRDSGETLRSISRLETEVADYQKLKALDILMPKLYDVDKDRELLLKEYIQGETIFNLVQEDKMKPEYINQVQNMCKILYANHLNIDYFPTNFMVCNELVYYLDYECNMYMEQWNFENWGINYWSKTPEFLFYVSRNLNRETRPEIDPK